MYLCMYVCMYVSLFLFLSRMLKYLVSLYFVPVFTNVHYEEYRMFTQMYNYVLMTASSDNNV